MKQLLVMLTLFTSMSSFAENCEVLEIKIDDDIVLDRGFLVDTLLDKGFQEISRELDADEMHDFRFKRGNTFTNVYISSSYEPSKCQIQSGYTSDPRGAASYIGELWDNFSCSLKNMSNGKTTHTITLNNYKVIAKIVESGEKPLSYNTAESLLKKVKNCSNY